jgi:tetratricopeptide (TPR) repeat protein
MRSIALLLVSLVWFVWLDGATASADPLARPASADARQHLDLGNKLYAVRSFDEAAAEYKAGALIEAAPVFDYNLGQCFRQLGKSQEALWHYERFLTRGNPQGELLDAVNGFIAQLKAGLAKPTAEPPAAPGSRPAPAPATSIPSAASSPASAPASAPPAQIAPAADRPAEPWYRDGLGWGLTGAGVAGIAAGGLLLLDARGLDDDADANLDQRNSKQQHDKASSRRLAGEIAGAGGAGLLVAGVIKLVIHSDRSSRATVWTVAPAGRGLVVLGSF